MRCDDHNNRCFTCRTHRGRGGSVLHFQILYLEFYFIFVRAQKAQNVFIVPHSANPERAQHISYQTYQIDVRIITTGFTQEPTRAAYN